MVPIEPCHWPYPRRSRFIIVGPKEAQRCPDPAVCAHASGCVAMGKEEPRCPDTPAKTRPTAGPRPVATAVIGSVTTLTSVGSTSQVRRKQDSTTSAHPQQARTSPKTGSHLQVLALRGDP